MFDGKRVDLELLCAVLEAVSLRCRLIEAAIHTVLSEGHREVAHRIVKEAAATF